MVKALCLGSVRFFVRRIITVIRNVHRTRRFDPCSSHVLCFFFLFARKSFVSFFVLLCTWVILQL